MVMDCRVDSLLLYVVETATELGGMLSGTNSLPPIPEREDSLQRF